MENKVSYKWKRLFASINHQKGRIELTPVEAQELIDDIDTLTDLNPDLSDMSNVHMTSEVPFITLKSTLKCDDCGEIIEWGQNSKSRVCNDHYYHMSCKEQFCDCGKIIEREYDPCCGYGCWSKKFDR